MSVFPMFNLLPPELRLDIWRHAVKEERRIIKLDADIQVALCRGPPPKQERIIFGGYFWPQKPYGQRSLVWPPASQESLASLSLACRASRQVVCQEYPNTICIGETFIDEHLVAAMADLNVIQKPGQEPNLGRHLLLRCSFERDMVFLRQLCSTNWDVGNDVSFAEHVYACGSLKEALEADEFRSTLRKIRSLVIEGFNPDSGDHSRKRRENQLKALFAATTDVDTLYICPHGATFTQREINVEDFTQGMWDADASKELPETAQEDIKEIRKLYNDIVYRLLGKACYDVSASTIATVSNIVSDEVDVVRHPGCWRAVFATRLEVLGFRQSDQPSRELEIKPVTARRQSSEKEVVWLPNPGYIFEGDTY